jgi:hypothetical protein
MADYVLNKNLADEVEKKFSISLQNRDFIDLIIESAGNNKELFEELLFSSKYIMGLIRAISGGEHKTEGVITSELSDSISRIRNLIRDILGEKVKDYETVYLLDNQVSFSNLTLLAAQLELFKLHINDLKREG